MSSEDQGALAALAEEIHDCRLCPRLVEWREEQAANPPRRYRGQDYWARPVSGFGDPEARIAIVGLAPAAHGANRTGRMFTGDRSGDWLYAALHRAGFANQPHSEWRGDGLRAARRLRHRHGPLRPAGQQADPGGARHLPPLPAARAGAARPAARSWSRSAPSAGTASCARPGRSGSRCRGRGRRFGHGAEAELGRWRLLGCYHPSQQNTFTGRLTVQMTDAVFERARTLLG